MKQGMWRTSLVVLSAIGLGIVGVIAIASIASIEGCAGNTQGDQNDRKYGDTFVINDGSGTQTINFRVQASTTTDTDQAPENETEFSPRTAAGYNGQGTLGEAGSTQHDLSPTNVVKRIIDQSKTQSDNTTDKSTRTDNSVKVPDPLGTGTGETKPTEVKTDNTTSTSPDKEDGNPQPSEYAHSQTVALRWMPPHNRSFEWLDQTGANYGGPVKFVFSDGCGELYVPNAADDWNRGDPVNAVYFCGTKNKPEESNGIRASIFGPTGCKAKSVTMYWNGGK